MCAEFTGQQTTCLLKGERYLHLPEGKLSARWTGNGVELSCTEFARQVTLEFPGATGAVFDDNFFDLVPGQKKLVRVIESAGGDRLTVRAVNAPAIEVKQADLYAPHRVFTKSLALFRGLG